MTLRRQALIGALRDSDDRVRAQAAEALDRLEVLQGLDELLGQLRTFGKTDWLQLLLALSGRRDETSLRVGLRALEHRDEAVRLAGLDFVLSCGDLRAAPAACRRLADPSGLVRARAAQVMGGLGDRRRGDDVAALLDDPDPRALSAAAEGVGLLDHRGSEHRLVELLSHDDAEVRAMAAQALGRMGEGGGPP